MTSKHCPRCKETKTTNLFYKDRSRKDGLTCYCRDCQKTMTAKSPPKSKEKVREYRKRWETKNPEKLQAQRARYRAKHREELARKRREYYQRNKSQVKLAASDWAKENKDKRLAITRKSRNANIETVREQNRRWMQDNPEKVKASAQNRRARVRSAEGTHSGYDIQRLYAEQQGLCNGCYDPLESNYHVDHIIPLSRGGSNWSENLQLLCPTCNCSKGSKMPIEWAQTFNERI